jgi:NAD(P)-dependent dehydrogenase (short-subunit alcohol dehydrogenase family)
MNDTVVTPVWFITGCSRGLGLALARAVLARGHRVVATAREPASLDALVAANPAHCIALPLDLSQPAQIASTVAAAHAAFGRIDFLVNNAGAGLLGALEEFSEAQIAENFTVNFFGPVNLFRAVLPIFRAQKSGHVLSVSAAAAIANYPGFSIYGAAKRALESTLESLAAEGRGFGLKVTIVQPGAFRTEFFSRSVSRAAGHLADYDATSGKFCRYLETIDGKQPGDPALIADAILAAATADRPPLRLVLGAYANDKVKRTAAAAQRELETWAPVAAAATDFKTAPST